VEFAIDGAVPVGKPVKHLLEILARDYGLQQLSEAVKKPLSRLRWPVITAVC
jgi:heterodisulfide reductase subunit B